MLWRCLAIAICLAWLAPPSLAQDEGPKQRPEQRWGLGLSYRTANIPFATEEKTVSTLIPLVMFENDRFFFREIEGGVKIYQTGPWLFSGIGRIHFFDMPQQYQNELQGDTMDFGLQGRYMPFGSFFLDLEALSDWDGHSSGIVRAGLAKESRKWLFAAAAELRLKTEHYNSYFWGLKQERVAGGGDLSLGFKSYYHLWRNLYLQFAGKVTYLDRQVRRASLVEDDFHWQGFLGFGLGRDRSKPMKPSLSNPAYVRLAHCWATPSSLANIIRFDAERDPGNNQLSTIFYGHPLTDDLFTLPIDVYLHSGFGWHWKSKTQDHSQELILSIKIYYTIPLPLRIKLGAAEGLSWVNEIPSVERNNLEQKGYKPSQLLNYLDFSVDLSLGDIIRTNFMKPLWLGYYIHHRSAIFETAQQFGRIKGGSNFQSIALTYEF